MRFSIIIPCYNTAPYLKKCLESVIRQTYQDWEIIAVNDGSTDDTLDILKDYSDRDNRIKVINQENKGVSAARNKAIETANGEYIIFIDSDDWYKDAHSLEQIVKSLEHDDIDIIVFRYQCVTGKNESCSENVLLYFNKMKGYIYTGEKYLDTVLSIDKQYMWFSVLYAFKREFWTGNRFRFDENLWIQEDSDIIYKVLLKAEKVKVLDSPIYQYRIREDSACHSLSFQSMKEQLNCCLRNIDTVSSMDIQEDLKSLLYNNFVCTYFAILSMSNYLNKNDCKKVLKLLNKNQHLMRFAMTKNKKVIKVVAQILGIKATSRLLFIRLKYIKRIEHNENINHNPNIQR